MLPLEDLFNDVIAKAQRGLGLSNEALASQAGVSESAIEAVKDGAVDETVIGKIAPLLNLDGASVIAMARNAWRPEPLEVPGLAQFNTTYHDMTVNAYLVWDPATNQAAAFDTGADASPIISKAKELGLNLEVIFLTHTHPDHIADVDTLRTNAQPIHSSNKEPFAGSETFDCGKEFAFGGLRVETRQTWGHSRGGVTYVVQGLERPIAIVGDALFASSMGGGGVSYADALATNRKEIFSLPDNTVVCPGHGPLTTIEEEKAHNPFYPEFK